MERKYLEGRLPGGSSQWKKDADGNGTDLATKRQGYMLTVHRTCGRLVTSLTMVNGGGISLLYK